MVSDYKRGKSSTFNFELTELIGDGGEKRPLSLVLKITVCDAAMVNTVGNQTQDCFFFIESR